MRIALGIEYDGSRYFGWQRQREVISVQAELEKALSRIAAIADRARPADPFTRALTGPHDAQPRGTKRDGP